MSAATLCAPEEDGVVIFESSRHVVGVQDRDLCGFAQSSCAHQRDVHPRDGEDASAAEGSGGDSPGLALCASCERVRREEWGEVRGDADRTHARTPTSVRDAEGLVEVEVADVRADVSWTAETDLSVHVRTVHVDLSAVSVDELADAFHLDFEDTVC